MSGRSSAGGAWLQLLHACLSALLACALLPVAAFAQEREADGDRIDSIEAPHAEGEVVVVYEGQAPIARSLSNDSLPDIEDLGYEVSERIVQAEDGVDEIVVALVPDGKDVATAINELEATPGVAYVQPNFEYSLIDGVMEGDVQIVDDLNAQENMPVVEGANDALKADTRDQGALASSDAQSALDALAVVSDPFCTNATGSPNQWYLYASGVTSAWDYAKCQGSITVAVLDTGCRLDHEDLKGVIDAVHAYDCAESKPLADSSASDGDANGHGTHVCGIIGAQANNAKGIAGASYNASVLPVKVFDVEKNKASSSTIIAAYGYLASLMDAGSLDDLHVINMSLGYYASATSGTADKAVEEQIVKLRKRGVLTVCAGGNGKEGVPLTGKMIPSDLDACIAVTSLDRDGGNTYWSDYNKYKDISAPGTAVLSTYRASSSSYALMNGSSMASPLVAGSAALLWAVDPALTVDEAVSALLDAAEPVNDFENDRSAVSGSKGALNTDGSLRKVLGLSEPVDVPKIPLSSCAVSSIAAQAYTGSALMPKPTVTYESAILKEDVDYTLSYRNNVNVGTASVVIAGKGSYTGSKTVAFVISAPAKPDPDPTPPALTVSEVERLAGATALGTMTAISSKGFASGSCSSVVVATMSGYWDALTAASYAGLKNCPVLITDGERLSSETAGEIERLGVKTVYIAGGTAAVSSSVAASIKKIPGVARATRLAGDTAIGTSLAIYQAGKGSWGKIAVVATSYTFQDALSASPYAYARQAPVFLANATTKQLDSQVVSAIRNGDFTRVLIAGGTAAISSSVEKQLSGITCVRKGGATAYETSAAVARWCVSQGMKADNTGVATGRDYYDALTGAALCGKNDAVLILAADDYEAAATSFIKSNKASIKHAYVFGGPAAVSAKTYTVLQSALK